MENVLVAERLNDSVEVANKQLYVHNKLDIILRFAIYVTIVGTILFHILKILTGEDWNVFDNLGQVIDKLDRDFVRNFVNLIGLSIVSIGVVLSYLILFVLAYIIHAMDVSLRVVKPEYQVPRYQTLVIQWGYILLGVLNLIVVLADGEWAALIIGVWSIVLIIGVIWAHNLSKKWSKLGPEHKKLADLFRNYAYLQIGLFVMAAIGIVGVDWLEILNGAINLYLFFKLPSNYANVVLVSFRVFRPVGKANISQGAQVK